ncbi:MAG: hypothetical protein ACUVXA_02660 [Candidatus Jordarchaeum sp.]|uniref:hypothetical protein n=1 Tax=Candidatus Jordarchaeum sp. TaxID=2823881 RepID=UPI00404B0E68
MPSKNEDSSEKQDIEKVREYVGDILADPIVNKLLSSSNITSIQFETLLINFLLDEGAGKPVKYKIKGFLRAPSKKRRFRGPLKTKGVTRGAFRRVLGQACANVIKSIYSLVLLGYVGILDSPSLHTYLDMSNIISNYMEQMELSYGKDQSQEKKTALKILEKNLLDMIQKYADPFFLAGRSE